MFFMIETLVCLKWRSLSVQREILFGGGGVVLFFGGLFVVSFFFLK